MAQLFRDLSDITARAHYDESATIWLDSFSHLIGKYELTDDARCQVKRPSGRCGRRHRIGWVGIRADGTEVLIGGTCAKKHFKASEAFTSERRRIQRAIDFDTYSARLQDLLGGASELRSTIEAGLASVQRIRSELQTYQEALPSRTTKWLRDASKTGNATISVEVQDPNDRAWYNEPVRRLQGIAIWANPSCSTSRSTLHAGAQALDQAEASGTPTLDDLKRWCSSLEAIKPEYKRIESAALELAHFREIDNLHLLLYTARSHQDRCAIAHELLRSKGTPFTTASEAEKLIADMDRALRTKLRNQNFRIP